MGRIIDALADQGELDNTLVIYIEGDNGASAEGGPQGLLNEMAFFNAVPEDFKEVMRRPAEHVGQTAFTHYPIGWDHAATTEVQWAEDPGHHMAAPRSGMVISWPARIKDK